MNPDCYEISSENSDGFVKHRIIDQPLSSPTQQAPSQLKSNIQQGFVIPGLTRNPAVSHGLTKLDAGSGPA
jgi:hypothetical protein